MGPDLAAADPLLTIRGCSFYHMHATAAGDLAAPGAAAAAASRASRPERRFGARILHLSVVSTLQPSGEICSISFCLKNKKKWIQLASSKKDSLHSPAFTSA
jgi:hypothetical protein